ncbi:cupin [Marinobacter alexandrii]|uniref:cupin n=1 Tax=Marinobacter alexandrii TaxID=2570351 RepID=UPI003297472A
MAKFVTFGDGGTIPNNPILPVMLARGALPGHSASEICRHFEEMGWTGTWTYVVFDYHHYHHDAHEALCVASGWADIVLGGPEVGQTFRLEAGDLVVLPAGTGHCRIDSSPDFAICGSYPPGQSCYTIVRAQEGALARHGTAIAAVPLPGTDPVFGPYGPLLDGWGIS